MLLLSKLPISKVESFLKSNFIEIHRNALELKKKMSKKWSWKGTGPSKDQKFACTDNPRQNIWNKME